MTNLSSHVRIMAVALLCGVIHMMAAAIVFTPLVTTPANAGASKLVIVGFITTYDHMLYDLEKSEPEPEPDKPRTVLEEPVTFTDMVSQMNEEHYLMLGMFVALVLLLILLPILKRRQLFRDLNVLTETHRSPDAEDGDWSVYVDHASLQKQRIYQLLSQNILCPLVNKSIRVHLDKGALRPPVNDDDFHIFVGAWSDARLQVEAIRSSINGFYLPATPAYLVTPKADSHAIVDDQGQVIGEITGDNLYIFDNVVHKGQIQEAKYLAQLLCQVRTIIQENAGILSAAEQFAERCTALAEESLSSTLTQDTCEKEVQKLVSEAETAYKEWASNSLAPRIEAGKEYDDLMNLDKVRTVKIEGHRIIVTTRKLFCQNPKTGRTHEIGAFDFILDTVDQSILFMNRTRQVTIRNDSIMQAPHVNQSGVACFGNTKDTFRTLLSNREFATAATMAIIFIESVNLDDGWGKQINRWPVSYSY